MSKETVREITPTSQWRSVDGKSFEETLRLAREKGPKATNKKFITKSNKRLKK